MAIFCLLALVTGALAATALPLMPFVIGLIFAALVGGVATAMVIPTSQHVVLGASALFAATQVGYAVGLGAQAFARMLREKRRHGDPPFKTAAHRLRHVNTDD